MPSLPGRLEGLLRRHGNILPNGAEDELPLIKQDVEKIISIILHGYSKPKLEDNAMVVRCWMKEVRELSYDIEDCIDHYEHAMANSRSGFNDNIRRRKFNRRHGNKLPPWVQEKLKQRLWMANKMREFSTRAQEALQRHAMYSNHGVATTAAIASTNTCGIDVSSSSSLRPVRCEERAEDVLVGVDSAMNKLEDYLSGHAGEEKLRVLSIVGFGGIGKTTLANELYSKIGRQFECRAFVRASQKPDMRRILTSILSQLRPHQPPDHRKVHSLISSIRAHLQDKRYMVVIDNLWDISTWDIMRCALPDAIVTIANLLSSRLGKPKEWDYVNKSLCYSLVTNPTLEGMKQVLNLSYNSLPLHLKACLLYLTIYQEDYLIWKDDLVKQWIAEGFICTTEEQDKEEISGSYFDELLNRRMIQPVHINDNGEVISCVVHHMVMKFITYKSMEENFVISIDHSQTATKFADKVRRLSLDAGLTEDVMQPINMRLSQVRTLAFWGTSKFMPSIVDFRLLQVLILHLWDDHDNISLDLTRIAELFRLKYLKVTSNVILELQTQIQDARVNAVPSDVVQLRRLLHLSFPAETNLPNGIGQMTSLHTLGNFDLSGSSIENVQSLGELTNLQDLRLTCSTVQTDNLKNKLQLFLGSVLWKLSNLKSMILVSTGPFHEIPLDEPGDTNSANDTGATTTSVTISSDHGLSSVSSPHTLLQRLEFLPHSFIFSYLPKWISQLNKLCILKIGVSELVRNDVCVLCGLSVLAVLSLYIHNKPAERIIIGRTGFLALKYLKFKCRVPWLKFEANAMPILRKLKLCFNVYEADQHGTIPDGIEHLSGLREVSAKIGLSGTADDLDKRSVESALNDAIKMHPGHPRVNIQCVEWVFNGKEDNSSGSLQKQYNTRKRGSKEQRVIHKSQSKKRVLQNDSNEGSRERVDKREEISISESSSSDESIISSFSNIETQFDLSKSSVNMPGMDGLVKILYPRSIDERVSSCF
ncbi:disease resistance protein RGA5-like [Oryza glaberrima]|uniref:disease resistance protein RGA5-like n=1 Tax=Oryza glaberrima TaxID=4538 RepID=UPI00224BF64A|nr:disease resistance protein RGA5-like [Oryza glaberrima]